MKIFKNSALVYYLPLLIMKILFCVFANANAEMVATKNLHETRFFYFETIIFIVFCLDSTDEKTKNK